MGRPPERKPAWLIREARGDDLPAIADLHSRVLDWSINGRLGRDHVAAVYECLFAGDDIVGFVAMRDDRLLAFQISTLDYRAVRRRLSNLLAFHRKLRIVLGCLLHPSDLIALFETAFLVVPIMRRTGVTAEIVSWVGEPGNAAATFAAHDCLMKSLKAMAGRGERFCLAQFQKPNDRAYAYFRKLGIVPVRSLLRHDIFLVDCGSGEKDTGGSGIAGR